MSCRVILPTWCLRVSNINVCFLSGTGAETIMDVKRYQVALQSFRVGYSDIEIFLNSGQASGTATLVALVYHMVSSNADHLQ